MYVQKPKLFFHTNINPTKQTWQPKLPYIKKGDLCLFGQVKLEKKVNQLEKFYGLVVNLKKPKTLTTVTLLTFSIKGLKTRQFKSIKINNKNAILLKQKFNYQLYKLNKTTYK